MRSMTEFAPPPPIPSLVRLRIFLRRRPKKRKMAKCKTSHDSKEESSVTYNMEPATIGLIQKLQKNALNGKTAGILLAMLMG